MNANQHVVRDERTLVVESAGYRWAYIVFTYALLVDVMYRAMVHREAAWDLMALVIVGGAICTGHQIRGKTLGQGWVITATLIACAGAVIAFVAAYVWMRVR